MATEDFTLAQHPASAADEIKAQPSVVASAAGSDADYMPEKMPSSADEAQEGVREVEAVTLTWTKASLVTAFIW